MQSARRPPLTSGGEVGGSLHLQPSGSSRCACGRCTVNFSRLVGLSVSAKQLKEPVLCSPEGFRTCPEAVLLFLSLLLPLSGPSLPWLASV